MKRILIALVLCLGITGCSKWDYAVNAASGCQTFCRNVGWALEIDPTPLGQMDLAAGVCACGSPEAAKQG